MATCDDAVKPVEQVEPAAPSSRRQLRLVIVGHVDHGKSTLIGRLFHDTGSLPEGKYEQLVAIARRRGVPFEYANLMDSLQAERDQNITIDTAQIWFRTKTREYVIIDAPGHKEFVKNMVTGAARADAAVILIDVSEGVQDESRRHGYLLRLIGLRRVLVLVNKMDLVAYSRDAFGKVAAEYREFLAGIGLEAPDILPISARQGDNIAKRGDPLGWFAGPTVLEAFEAIPDRGGVVGEALRLPVQDVYRFDHRRILAGRVESGTVRVGDQILFLPSGRSSVVRSIERWNAPVVSAVGAGEPVGITLADQLFVERGAVACHATDAPTLTTEFTARVFWLGRTPLATGRRYKLKLVTQETECEVKAIEEVVDASTVQTIPGATSVRTNDAAKVVIHTRRPVAVDVFERIPTTGRLVLVDGFDVAGGGTIVEVPEQRVVAIDASANLTQVVRGERHFRHGHRGAVIWLTGVPGSGKATLARIIERRLFERGTQVFVLGQNLRSGLAADLGVSAADRTELIRRVAEVAKLFAEAGAVCITTFTSRRRDDRQRAREIVQAGGEGARFCEVYLETPLQDATIAYEPPDQAELVIDVVKQPIEESADRLLERILSTIR
jgi:bifunctional enzyme CysN/CysC